MTARAALATEQVVDRAGRVVTRVHTLRSQTPLVLRPVHARGFEPLVHHADDVARVALASGAAGPLGGDDFELNVRVGAGSTLLLNEISATLLLPGARGGRSRMRITISVEEDAKLVWLAEPVIAAHGCNHVHDIRIELAPSARLLMRDELLFGRHEEAPGDLSQHIRVNHGGDPLFHQQLRFGPTARGSASPAVLGSNKCIGTVLVVDPAWRDNKPDAALIADDAALMPLAGPAVQISALAPQIPSLRRLMDRGIALLGEPWAAPDTATRQTETSPGARRCATVT